MDAMSCRELVQKPTGHGFKPPCRQKHLFNNIYCCAIHAVTIVTKRRKPSTQGAVSSNHTISASVQNIQLVMLHTAEDASGIVIDQHDNNSRH